MIYKTLIVLIMAWMLPIIPPVCWLIRYPVRECYQDWWRFITFIAEGD